MIDFNRIISFLADPFGADEVAEDMLCSSNIASTMLIRPF